MRFWIVAAALSLYGATAQAEGGVDFAAMPEGCSWQTMMSDGSVRTETFVGKVKGKYRVKIVDARSGAAVSHIDYNAEGLMVRRNWADGRRERFEPFSCFTVPGTCSYTYLNGAGEQFKIDSEVKRGANGFTSAARPRGGSVYPVEQFTLGAFGLVTSTRSANYSTRITKFSGCGPVS
jgi:hypothetical protein